MLAPIFAIALTSVTAQVGASGPIQAVQDLASVTTGVGFTPPSGAVGASLSTTPVNLITAHGAGLLTQAADTGRASAVQSATALAVRVVISTAGRAN